MEKINHFLILHKEVGWGVRVEPKLKRICPAQPGLVLSGFVNTGKGTGGVTGGKALLQDAPARGHEGLKAICPEAASPGSRSQNGGCQAALFPGRGSPAPLQTPGPQEWGAMNLRGHHSSLGGGDPERWKCTLKSRPPGHEFQEKIFLKDSVQK